MRTALRMLQASQAVKSINSRVLERRVFNHIPGQAKPAPVKASALEDGILKYWKGLGPAQKIEREKSLKLLIPPANVTGALHIGHATMLSVLDMLARYHRMRGYDVDFRPGLDHGGIATESVVARKLMEKGISKKDLTREEFLEKIWEWTKLYGGRINSQIDRMGVSAEKEKEYFTLDDDRSEAVKNAFILLHEQGLIYRDTRMVNWSTSLQTALSDIEVDYVDVSKPTYLGSTNYGYMWEVAYKVVDSEEIVIVATTRPETIFGDRAVAVHPDDERYKHLHYKLLQHPLLPSVQIPVIPDAELVDPTLGTGAVKITPAHDPNDYEFWRRHSSLSPSAKEGETRLPIPIVEVFNLQGKMLESCGLESGLVGKDRLASRKTTVDLLEAAGALEGKHNHAMRVAVCSRSHCVIEPMLMPQWYLSMKPLANKALELSKSQGLKIRPQRFEIEWQRWLENIQDWCLSRQIVWGHRIPAWAVRNGSGKELRWIIASSEADALEKVTAEEKESGCVVKQDEDVLDTWFSSGLLPLSTAGWKGTSDESWKKHYPLTIMESGADILFFWLARMAMLCGWFSNQIPFQEILLHPLIADANGRKMSKSEGNVLDPEWFIYGRTLEELLSQFAPEKGAAESKPEAAKTKALKEIKKKEKQIKTDFPKGIKDEGADSLRMSLAFYSSSKRDSVGLDPATVNMYRRLIVKLENAVKLIKYNEPEGFYRPVPVALSEEFIQTLRPHEFFLIHHLRNTIASVNSNVEQRDIGAALTELYNFIYDQYCSIYLEFAKSDLQSSDEARRGQAKDLANFSMDLILRMLHPYAPFITEDLWQNLDVNERLEKADKSIANAVFPETTMLPRFDSEDSSIKSFEMLRGFLERGRALAAKDKEGVKNTELKFGVPSEQLEVARGYEQDLARLINAKGVRMLDENDPALKELL